MTAPETIVLATPDGRQPVKLFVPFGVPRGGAIFFMDAFGWREELDHMAARYAEAGWLTALPEMYYRLGSPQFAPPSAPGRLDPAMHAANSATTMAMSAADTAVLLAHLAESHPAVRRFGTVGYCMGGRHAVSAAVSHPDRITAAASLHGGRLVDDTPQSPHLLIGRADVALYFGFAEDDETCSDDHQALIEQRLVETGARAEVDHYRARHGWTFPTRWCHDRPAAERAFAKVLALFEREVA